MFTGIITGVGHITTSTALGSDAAHGRQLRIATPAGYLDDVGLGDSIAINGACMTVTTCDAGASTFSIDVSAESLDKTAGLAELGPVNLEKALRANDRLGGHLVSGHVDGTGRVTYFAEAGESWTLRLDVPASLARFLAYKGSITVNGVSLTVNSVFDHDSDRDADLTDKPTDGPTAGPHAGCEISINLIPHTIRHTALGYLQMGSRVNLEIDLIARYVERMQTVASRSSPA